MKATREFVERVYEIYGETGSLKETAQRVGVSDATVGRWIKDPARFDPYIDEIAVERALLGERKVFQALTRWELDVVMDRLKEILDMQEDSVRMGEIYDLYCESWGVPYDTLSQFLTRRVRAGTAA